jgi:hypothetical protein
MMRDVRFSVTGLASPVKGRHAKQAEETKETGQRGQGRWIAVTTARVLPATDLLAKRQMHFLP